jgi:hypothetical protein
MTTATMMLNLDDTDELTATTFLNVGLNSVRPQTNRA